MMDINPATTAAEAESAAETLNVAVPDRESGPARRGRPRARKGKSGAAAMGERADLRLVPTDSREQLSSNEPGDDEQFEGQAQPMASGGQIRAYAEELKHVLAMLGKDHSVRRATQRVVVAGVNSGFDASRIAWGLALTSAGSGFRVLLVDANLNRPAAHQQFGVSNDFGLSDLLVSADSPHRFPQSTQMPNLAVIAAGPKLSIYASLLAREQVFHRLQPLARYFDYIIADAGSLTPALLARVSEGADNVILTVRQHVSSMHELASVVRTLRDVDAPEPSVLMIE